MDCLRKAATELEKEGHEVEAQQLRELDVQEEKEEGKNAPRAGGSERELVTLN